MFLYSLGFGLAVSWLWLFYLVGPLLDPVCTLWNISPEILFRWFIGSVWVTCLILFQILRIISIRYKKWVLVPSTIVLSLSPLLTVVLPLLSAEYTNPVIANILAVVSGIALAFFYTAWMETMSMSNLKKNSMVFAIGILVAGSITLLGGIVHYYWILPFIVLFPPISLVLMLRQTPDESIFLAEYQKIDSVKPFPMKLIVLIGLIYISGGTIYNIISMEQSFVNMFYLSNISYVLFCLLAGITLYRHEDMDLRFIYQMILPLLSVGFLTFCAQGNYMAIVAFVLLQGGIALLDTYTWLVFPYFARFSTRPAAVCAFGLFIMTFSIFMGNIIVDILTTILSDGHNVKNLAFIAGVLSVSAVFLLPDKKETFSGWQALFNPQPQALAPEEPSHPTANSLPLMESQPFDPEKQQSSQDEVKVSDALSSLDNLPLSLREKDVLILLLKGRSGRFISENLNISSNTVKFHTRNIYSKLYVNSRQELLTMFENKQHSQNDDIFPIKII